MNKIGEISNTNFTVIDVETTGLNASHNRITEIALVKVLNGEIVSEFSSMVNPEQFIPPYISALTGITNELVYDKPKFEYLLPNIKAFISDDNGTVILAGHNVNFDYKFLNEAFRRAGAENLNLSTLCTCRLARRMERTLPSKSLGTLSRYFRIKIRRRHRALDDAKATAHILINFLDRLINEFAIETLDEVLSFQYKKIYELSKIPKNLKRIKLDLHNVPSKPGVYYMKNKKDIILYIGKARNLKERLSSYFYHNVSHTNKIKKLIRQVYKIEYEVTASELSALILESKLIKQHKPKFNSAIRSYRKYPFIRIDEQNRFPKAEKTYEVKLDGAKYYGPFRSSFTVNSLLDRISKTFKLRKCDDKKLIPNLKRTPCIYYQIYQCGAPCNFTQNEDEYREEVKRVNLFFKSKTETSSLKILEDKMYRLSNEMKYEEAAAIRDEITDLKKVILNMELTSSEVNLQNYIVKCRESNGTNGYEVFLIASGRLLKSINLDMSIKHLYYEQDAIADDINNIYFRGNLFNSLYYNDYGKMNKEELDKMKIISNWIYQNNSPSTLLKLNGKTTVKDVMEFING